MVQLTEPEPSRQTGGVRLRETAAVNAPLNARPNDVVQGNLAGCPVVAALVALAHTRPANISRMLGPPNQDDVFSKRRNDEIFRFWTRFYHDVRFPGAPGPTRISGMLYHQGQRVVYAGLPGGPGWPSLIEKAYAVWRGANSYDRLDKRSNPNAPDGGQVVCDLVGTYDMAAMIDGRYYPRVNCRDRTSNADRGLNANADILAMARRAGRRPTIAATLAQNPGHGLVSDHAYAVMGVSRGRIRLRNPHGGPGADVRLTPAQVAGAFQAVWQAY